LGSLEPWGECGKLICGELYLNPERYKLKRANHLKFEMFLKSKLVFSKGTCISLDFDFNPRLRENILTLFIFNIIIQNRGLFHICISYLNSSQIPYHGSFVDMTNKNSSGSLNVIGDEENDGWGYFIIVANSRALVLLGESNSKSYSFGTRTTRLPKIPSTIFLWNEDN